MAYIIYNIESDKYFQDLTIAKNLLWDVTLTNNLIKACIFKTKEQATMVCYDINKEYENNPFVVHEFAEDGIKECPNCKSKNVIARYILMYSQGGECQDCGTNFTKWLKRGDNNGQH